MKRKIKNTILKTVAVVMALLFIISGSALDNHSWVQYIVCGGSLAWLALFVYANKEWIERRCN